MKTKGQSRMDNPETNKTQYTIQHRKLGTQDTDKLNTKKHNTEN